MATTAKIGTRELQRLATRERLFTAAVGECKRSGVVGADIGRIVKEAGVAHGTFFFHFPSKEHVVAELGQREEIRVAKELDRFLSVPRDLRATTMEVVRLTALLERRLGPALFKDMLALYFSPTSAERQPWTDHPVVARVIGEFQRARDAGKLSSPDIDAVNAASFFFLGLYSLLVVHEKTPERAGTIEQFVAVLLRGLGVR